MATQGHQCFIFPGSIKVQDLFKTLSDEIDWEQKINKCNVGDYVYIYMGYPYQRLQFKTEVLGTNIPIEEANFSKGDEIPTDPTTKYIRLKLVENYGDNGVKIKDLRDFGVRNFQGPRQIDYDIARKIEEKTHPTHKRGKFSSWEVLSEDVVIKQTDLSFFSHNGSNVSKEILWFFETELLSEKGRKDITLFYNGSKYDGYIKITIPEFDKNPRQRLFWSSSLGVEFKSVLDKNNGSYPSLRFFKKSSSEYEIEFINLSAIEENPFTEDDEPSDKQEGKTEGKKKSYWTTKYERDPNNRRETIKLMGTKCVVCGFDFEETYGERGKDFIEVHHTKPLYELKDEVKLTPGIDLVCVCSNCHRMIHRKKDNVLSVEELKSIIQNRSKETE